MNVDERRAAILAVAVPMLVEHGGSVKTGDIAAAAGIAEGTLFRAFNDKQALFRACLRATLESEDEVGRIESIDMALPLADRLTAGVRAVTDYQSRLWAVAVALRSAGVDPREPGEGRDDGPPKAMIRISSAIAALFDAAVLRIQPDLAARLLLGFVFSNRLFDEGLGGSGAELSELVDVFLHGVLKGDQA